MENTIESIGEKLILKYSVTSLKQYYPDMTYDINLHRRACISNALNEVYSVIDNLKKIQKAIDYPHAIIMPLIGEQIEVNEYLKKELVKTY